MSFLEALILGIVQGLTEFLPVSSSGHIELAQAWFGMSDLGDKEEQLSVVLHLATALSTMVVFRKDIATIFKDLLQFKWNESTQLVAKIILSMIPAGIVYVTFESYISSFFTGQILLVGCMLLLTGGLLLLADKATTTSNAVTLPKAFTIGIAQAIAMLPGISRSGSTISTAVLLKIDRDKAARFSFLMVLPLILAKVGMDALDIVKGDMVIASDMSMAFIVGFAAAFLTGIAACTWMINLVKRAKLTYFSIYCFVVGVVAIIWSIL